MAPKPAALTYAAIEPCLDRATGHFVGRPGTDCLIIISTTVPCSAGDLLSTGFGTLSEVL